MMTKIQCRALQSLIGASMAYVLFCPINAYAQTEEPPIELEPVAIPELQRTGGENGELQAYLPAGTQAPFDGILLNPQAAAFIVTEFSTMYAELVATVEFQRISDQIRLDFEVDKLRLRLETTQEISEIRISGLQRENERMQRVVQDMIDERDSFWNTVFGDIVKIGGGVLVGLAAGIVIGVFMGL